MSDQSTTLDQFSPQPSTETGGETVDSSTAIEPDTDPSATTIESEAESETGTKPESKTASCAADSVTNGEIDLTDDVKRYLIKDQMGSLIDALREAGQNGIDSPESEKVLISVDPDRSVIVDDGNGVDLSSAEDQENLTVLGAGTKDRGDDETIGEWGIGKGPVLGLGATRIWSRGYELFFDYEDRRSEGPFADAQGVQWAIREADHYLDGLMVEIDHYADEVADEDSYEWSNYETKLEKRFQYASLSRGVDVVVNGTAVGSGHPNDTITSENETKFQKAETDDAYIALEHSPNGSVEVYSNGIYVTDADVEGVCGAVVTKTNLTLNFARNAIQDRCETWSAIHDEILAHRTEIFTAMPDSKLSTAARSAMVDLMASDRDLRGAWQGRDLFMLANEQPTSLKRITLTSEISWANSNTKGADKLVEKGYLVLDKTDRASKRLREHDAIFQLPETFDATERAIEEEVWTGYERIEDESTLNTRQQHRLLFARALCSACGEHRNVYYGESESLAWTDGRTHITITDTATESNRREIWMHELYIIMMHEISHDSSDKEQPGHGRLFGKRYYDNMESDEHWDAYRELVETVLDEGFEDAFLEYGVSITYNQ